MIKKLPINYMEDNLTVRVIQGGHDSYDFKTTHRTVEIIYTGKDPDVTQKWEIQHIQISKQGITINLKC